MEESNETYAYFWVADFECTPEEITNIIGLKPSRVVLKGEPLNNGRVRKRSFWEFHSTLPITEVFQDAHLSNLMGPLLRKRDEINKIGSRFEVGISCVGYYTNVNPGFHMSAKLIKQCAELGVSIDFDLYTMRPLHEACEVIW